MVYTSTHWITINIVCQLFLGPLCHAYVTHYMDQYPLKRNKTIILGYTNTKDSSVVLKASRKSFPSIGRYQIIFKPPLNSRDSYGLVGTVQKFNLARDSPFCSDHIEIMKIIGSSKERHYSGCLSKPDTIEINAYQSINAVNVLFTLDIGESKNKLDGFEITISAFRRCDCEFKELIREAYEISCSNGTCIHNGLKCDGRDNCGDNQDESTDICTNSQNSWKIGIIVGILLFIFICMVIGFSRFHKRKPKRNETVTTLPAQTLPSAPCAHHQNPNSLQPQVQMPQPWTYPYNETIPNKHLERNDPPPPYYTVVNS